MSHTEREHLASEITMLEDLLNQIPEDQVIDRISFETRLDNARLSLHELPVEPTPHKAKLTFRGEPVVRSEGIYASFAGNAAHVFSEAFVALSESLAGNLGAGGSIAGGDRSSLLITGTATGSFGFEFEVPEDPNFLECDSKPSTIQAIAMMQDLFEESLSPESEKLSDIVAEIHPRAVKKAKEFLELLTKNQAWCGIEYHGRRFSFENISQVQSSIDMLSDSNIREETKTLSGTIQGVLPDAQELELRLEDEEKVLRIQIKPRWVNTDKLLQLMDTSISVQLRESQVGNRRPRYLLESEDHLTPLE